MIRFRDVIVNSSFEIRKQTCEYINRTKAHNCEGDELRKAFLKLEIAWKGIHIPGD